MYVCAAARLLQQPLMQFVVASNRCPRHAPHAGRSSPRAHQVQPHDLHQAAVRRHAFAWRRRIRARGRTPTAHTLPRALFITPPETNQTRTLRAVFRCPHAQRQLSLPRQRAERQAQQQVKLVRVSFVSHHVTPHHHLQQWRAARMRVRRSAFRAGLPQGRGESGGGPPRHHHPVSSLGFCNKCRHVLRHLSTGSIGRHVLVPADRLTMVKQGRPAPRQAAARRRRPTPHSAW